MPPVGLSFEVISDLNKRAKSRRTSDSSTIIAIEVSDVQERTDPESGPGSLRRANGSRWTRLGGCGTLPAVQYQWCARLLLLAGLLWSAVPRAAAATDEQLAAATIVVFNQRDPRSVTLAETYRAARAIPVENVIGLETAIAETVSREAYNQEIAGPLRAELVERGLWKVAAGEEGKVLRTRIRFCALIRGIPLRIQRDDTISDAPANLQEQFKPRNEAAIDSELAALGLGGGPLCGPIPNPYYRSYLRILESSLPPGLLLVTRLDGPLGSEVERVIADGLVVEKNGLWGRAYLDARGIQSGNYQLGDEWIRGAADLLRKGGVPVFLDDRPATLPKAYRPEDAAFYLGWYSQNVVGPFAEESFRFTPGAVAAHLHSFSATSVRTPGKGWVAPLLARGATATLGNVYEPYLQLTANFDLLTDRLLSGFTFAEAAYISIPALSWMGTFVGDPLYRPYRVPNDVLLAVEADETPYSRYRATVERIGIESTRLQPALDELATRESRPGLLSGSADLAQRRSAFDEALGILDVEMARETSDVGRFRVFFEKVAVLQRAGRTDAARQLLESGLGSFTEGDQVNAISAELERLDKSKGG